MLIQVVIAFETFRAQFTAVRPRGELVTGGLLHVANNGVASLELLQTVNTLKVTLLGEMAFFEMQNEEHIATKGSVAWWTEEM